MNNVVMQNISDALDMNALTVEDGAVETLPVVSTGAAEQTEHEKQALEDFEEARIVQKEIIEQGRKALGMAVSVAVSGQQPRDFEVTSKLLADLTNANKAILELHDTRMSLVPDKEPEAQSTVTNNNTIVVSSAAELLQLVEAKRKADKANQDQVVDADSKDVTDDPGA